MNKLTHLILCILSFNLALGQNQPMPSAALQPPAFSAPSGFYSSDFQLSLSHTDPSVTIVYTTDGSIPDIDNVAGKTYNYKNHYIELPSQPDGTLLQGSFKSVLYSAPIEISDRSSQPNDISSISTTFSANPTYIPTTPVLKSTIVRAKAFKSGSQPSSTVTATYFLNASDVPPFTLPIVSLSFDEDRFFGYENGIHVAGKDFDDWRELHPTENALSSDANYNNTGDEWEVASNFSYFLNGQEAFNQDVGIRINGGYSRLHPNKSLRLYARAELGGNTLNYPFFDDLNDDEFKTFILRNSGSDAYHTYFRDAFVHRLAKHLNLQTQAYNPAIAFLNGEYWGMLNFRERYDKHYFKRTFGINDTELDFLEYNGDLIQEGDSAHYMSMMNFISTNDMSQDLNYSHVCTLMDVDNFVDFFITNIYARNTDWPHNNIEFWRKRTTSYNPNAAYGHDGRWRWLLKDTDFGFGSEGGPNAVSHNTLEFASSTGGDESTNPEWSTLLFRKLLENESFRLKFINRFADVLNTSFKPERANALIDEMKQKIEPEIVRHGARWNSITIWSWNNAVDVMRNFANERPGIQRQHIREKFLLSDEISISVDVADADTGFVRINSIDITAQTPGVEANPYPWTGTYFKTVPIPVKAIAAPGYEFSHWSGHSNATSAEIWVFPTDDVQLTAHFVPTTEDPELPIAFWMFDDDVPNDLPLTSLTSTYSLIGDATLSYESAFEGYPFTPTHENWRKASMERRNSPTEINYEPLANGGILFGDADMKGLQIRQPFKSGSRENTMIFDLSTVGYSNIKMAFAAKDEGAASGILVDYSVTPGAPQWSTSQLPQSLFSLTGNYSLFEVDFSEIPSAQNNQFFKVRLRFTGTNMTADNGDRVTFNNIGFTGSAGMSVEDPQILSMVVYPNPFTDVINISNAPSGAKFSLFSIDGRLLKTGEISNGQISLPQLQAGLFLLQINSGSSSHTFRMIKQ